MFLPLLLEDFCGVATLPTTWPTAFWRRHWLPSSEAMRPPRRPLTSRLPTSSPLSSPPVRHYLVQGSFLGLEQPTVTGATVRHVDYLSPARLRHLDPQVTGLGFR